MTFKEFYKPTFSTSEFEEAKTRDGQIPKITSIVPGNTPGTPQIVYGKVSRNGMEEKVEWNQFGECHKYYPTARCRKWDLIHPQNSQIASAQEYMIGLAIFIIMLAIAVLH